MPQWISGELFTGSGKKCEDLKEKQVLVFSETVRGKDICWSAEWIDYDKMLSMQVLQRTTQWHCPGCVTTHEGSGIALLEEQTVNISLFASQHCTTPTNYPKVTQYIIKCFITDYILVGDQLYTQLARPFPLHAEVGWLTRLSLIVQE